jgi:N-acetylneuraminic acid mutarotase
MLIIATMVFAVFNFPSVHAQTAQPQSWTTVAPLPTARGGFAVAVVNGRIYAIGGSTGTSTFNVNEMYTLGTNTWTSEAPMPTARTDCAVAVYNNEIYVIGGEVGGGYVGNNEVYDPATNTWQTEASMPTPRADLSANVVDGKIYLIGGGEYSNTSPFYSETDVNEIYDPANNTWSTGSPIPTAVYDYSSAVIDGEIYVIGGLQVLNSQGTSLYVNSNQVYNPQNNTWSSGADFPYPVAHAAAAATTGFSAPPLLYVIGGNFQDSYSSSVQIYDPVNDSWGTGVSMPTARAYLGVADVNDLLFAIGGFDGQNWLGTVEEYTPIGYGTVPPIIQVNSPLNKTYNEVTLNYTVDKNVDWTGYSLDNHANVTLNGDTELFNLTQGAHSIVVYANDSVGNMGASSKVFFSFDTLPPDIDVSMPMNQSYGSTDIQLTFFVDKPIASMSYSLDGQKNVTMDGNVTLPALSNGSHNLTIYVTDEVGNNGSATVYFNIAPFPTVLVVAAAVSVVIALALGYILFESKKPAKPQLKPAPKF